MSHIERHGKGYRIRWTNAAGVRERATFLTREVALVELKRRQYESRAHRLGILAAPPKPKTFFAAADWFLENHSKIFKRSYDDDVSIIEKCKAFFRSDF